MSLHTEETASQLVKRLTFEDGDRTSKVRLLVAFKPRSASRSAIGFV